MSSFSVEDVSTPEDAVELQNETNYWVDSAPKAKFFVVDASYVVLLLFATIDIYSPRTLTILGVSFIALFILEIKDISFMEFYESIKMRLAGKKSVRH